MKAYTDIEQSRKLLALGIPTDSADMCYPHLLKGGADTYCEVPEIAEDVDYPYEMPCWSLPALFELMAEEIVEETKDGTFYRVYHPIMKRYKFNNYCVGYVSSLVGIPHLHNEYSNISPIDAAVEMISWLKEHKYI